LELHEILISYHSVNLWLCEKADNASFMIRSLFQLSLLMQVLLELLIVDHTRWTAGRHVVHEYVDFGGLMDTGRVLRLDVPLAPQLQHGRRW
jgi:hypothetical protein